MSKTKWRFDWNRLSQVAHTSILGSITLLVSATATYALPGQKLEVIREWTKESFVLPPDLVYNPDYDAYTGLRTIDGGLLALYVKVRPQDEVSVREQVVAQIHAPGLEFERGNAQGLKFIERLYSPEIAKDFQASKFVAQIGETDFYQGKKFAYTTLHQQGIRRFSVLPLSNLMQSVQREVSCQNKNCIRYQPFLPIPKTQ